MAAPRPVWGRLAANSDASWCWRIEYHALAGGPSNSSSRLQPTTPTTSAIAAIRTTRCAAVRRATMGDSGWAVVPVTGRVSCTEVSNAVMPRSGERDGQPVCASRR